MNKINSPTQMRQKKDINETRHGGDWEWTIVEDQKLL